MASAGLQVCFRARRDPGGGPPTAQTPLKSGQGNSEGDGGPWRDGEEGVLHASRRLPARRAYVGRGLMPKVECGTSVHALEMDKCSACERPEGV